MELQPQYKPYPRLRGAVLLLAGLGLAKWQIYDPLHAAENGVHEVTLYGLAQFLGIILPLLGLAMVLAGHGVERFLHTLRFDPKRLNWKSAVFLLFFVGLGIYAWEWVNHALTAQGYH